MSKRSSLQFETMTWAQMADIVLSIWKETKRRNPIGVNCYAPTVKNAALLLREIADAEAVHFTSENGPRERK